MNKKIFFLTMAAAFITFSVGSIPADAWAKKPESVSIQVSPKVIHMRVNRQVARVNGNRRVTVTVTRKQPGNACTKVPLIRIVEGSDPLRLNEMAFEKVSSRRRGLCNFTKRISVQPFSNQEILKQCARRGYRTITKTATVSFWKTQPVKTKYVVDGYKQECRMYRENCRAVQPIDRHPGEVRCDNVRRCKQVPYGHQGPCDKVCGGKRIKNKKGKQAADHKFRFAAYIQCQ